MKYNIKHCPFCGSENVRRCGENEKDPEDNHECHHIICDNCNIDVDLSCHGNSETIEELFLECLEKWNSRV